MILHTQDGGDSWQWQDPGSDNEVFDIFFLNDTLGWAATYRFDTLPYGTELLKTTDGGNNWQQLPAQLDNLFITCIEFKNPELGWMGGRPHILMKTTDGGNTWIQSVVDTSTLAFFPVLNLKFYDTLTGFACGGIIDIAGVIWRTTDGGDHWEAIDPAYAPADEVYGLHIFDPLHVMGAGGDPDFGYGMATLVTEDGGITWSYFEHGITGNAFGLAFRNNNEAWCPMGNQPVLAVSYDAGVSWEPVSTPGNALLVDITFPDSMHGYAVGQSGAFVRYKSIITGNSEEYSHPAGTSVYYLPGSGRIVVDLPADEGELQGKYLEIFSVAGEGKFRKRLENSGRADVIVDLQPGIWLYRLTYRKATGRQALLTGKLLVH
ncbi:MAG: hypothetical protein Kow00127_17770 [Bacteroidales bacterium]